MKELYFAWYAVKKNIQSSAELRTSFLANIVGMMLNNSVFIIIWVFFVKSVGTINGWTAADIVGLLGFGSLSYGVVFSTMCGVGRIADYVAGGGFDRFMLSPKNLLVRVATSVFGVSAIGDIVFGVACLVVYGILIQVSAIQVLFIVLLAFISIFMFLAVILVAQSASFLFVDAHAVSGGLFEFFLTPSLFHGGAFQGAIRFVFTFIIPSLVVGALPVEAVRDIAFEKLLIMGAVTVVWFFVSLKLFYAGVRKYESSNFMTFGN